MSPVSKQLVALLFAVLYWVVADAASAADYVIDPAHTSIHFKVGHFQFSKVQGSFNGIRGGFSFDPADPEASHVRVVVDVGSIDTNHRERDDHMRDAEYFDVAQFPQAIFQSTDIIVTGPRTGLVIGDLSIRGTTITVTLDVAFNGISPHPLGDQLDIYRGVIVAGFSARTIIKRSSFGMTAGGGEKGNAAELSIEVEGWHKP